MKLNIFNTQDKIITGYNNIKLHNNDIEVEKFPANSCEDIICHDIIDFVSQQHIQQFLTRLSSRLRMNGTMVINGIDINILLKQVLSGETSRVDFNNIIQNRQSLSSMVDIVNILKYNHMIITDAKFKGIEYEIRSTR